MRVYILWYRSSFKKVHKEGRKLVNYEGRKEGIILYYPKHSKENIYWLVLSTNL